MQLQLAPMVFVPDSAGEARDPGVLGVQMYVFVLMQVICHAVLCTQDSFPDRNEQGR